MKTFVFYSLLIILIQKLYSFNFSSNEDNDVIEVKKLLDCNETLIYIYEDVNQTINCANCIPDKIKSFGNKTFLCNFPRKDESCPFTFALFKEGNNYFEPWLNLDSNNLNSNQENLTSVTAFEIDENNSVYILDNGKFNNSEQSNTIKLLKYTKDRIFNGKIVFSDINSTNVINIKDYSFNFTDMVYDKKHNYMILSDSSFSLDESNRLESKNPGIFILELDFGNPKLYKILNDNEIFKPDKTYWYHFNDIPVYNNSPIKIGITGLTLSCDEKYLFFTSLSSRKFYSINTHEIKECVSKCEKNESVNDCININYYYSYKKEASFGLVLSNKGNLYMSGIESGSIYLANQIDYDLNRFDYRDLYQIKIKENNMLVKYLDINDDRVYFIVNRINDVFENLTIETNDASPIFEINYIDAEGEKSYRYGCYGIDYTFKPGSVVIWIIFLFVLFIVFVFVCASRPSNEVKYAALKDNQ